MVAGYLLARAGIPVTVLEKHADFLRDFRGDTIHPSTLTVMQELGLLEEFLARPHQEVQYAEAQIGSRRLRIGDFSHVPGPCKFIAFMPQWDFLDFIAEKAKAFPNFTLLMETEALSLMREGMRVTGVAVRDKKGKRKLKADLVLGADGRTSTLRNSAVLAVTDLGSPIDVLWFRLPFEKGDQNAVLGRLAGGRFMVMLYRGDYWQCALVIRKGTFKDVKALGLDRFRAQISKITEKDASAIRSWDDVKLLTVKVDRLARWHLPGLLFIGDAAHAMSPIAGVGINLAIQDAVAAANILVTPLMEGRATEDDLARVQKRRTFPTRATQALQTFIQNKIVDPILESGRTPPVPWPMRLLNAMPFLQRLTARLMGVGFRPEHVHTPVA